MHINKDRKIPNKNIPLLQDDEHGAAIDVLLLALNSPHEHYYNNFLLPSFEECLGLEYLAGVLEKNNHKTKVLYEMNSEEFVKDLDKYLSNSPTLVGFYTMIHTLKEIVELSKSIKSRCPQCHVTVGGPVVSRIGKELLENNEHIDSICLGEGEASILKLVRNLKLGISLRNISGILLRTDKNSIVNLHDSFQHHLDILPFPKREFLKEYANTEYLPIPAARVLTSRGCPYNCSFCLNSNKPQQHKWRKRNIINVYEEILDLKRQYDVKIIVFNDMNILGNTKNWFGRFKLLSDFLDASHSKLRFWAMWPIASNTFPSRHALRFLKQMGFIGFTIGIEAGNARQLMTYNRPISDPGKIAEYVICFRRYNFALEIGFLMFDPWVNVNELKCNAAFLSKIDEASVFSNFTRKVELYPGTKIAENAQKGGLVSQSSLYGIQFQFKNKDVQEIFNLVNQVGGQLAVYDKIVRELKLVSSILADGSGYNEILNDIRKGLVNIGQIHYEFFSKYLSPNGTTYGDKNFIGDHVNRLKNELKKFRKPLIKLASRLHESDGTNEDFLPLALFLDSFAFNYVFKDDSATLT